MPQEKEIRCPYYEQLDPLARLHQLSGDRDENFAVVVNRFVASHFRFYEDTIVSFARQVPTAPAVVAGRLHNEERMERKFKNSLRGKLDWDENGQLLLAR